MKTAVEALGWCRRIPRRQVASELLFFGTCARGVAADAAQAGQWRISLFAADMAIRLLGREAGRKEAHGKIAGDALVVRASVLHLLGRHRAAGRAARSALDLYLQHGLIGGIQNVRELLNEIDEGS